MTMWSPEHNPHAIPEGARGRGPTSTGAERDPFLQELLAALQDLGNGTRQAVADALWAKLPTVYWESAYNPAATQVFPTPRQENLVTVTTIVASVPSGATGLVQLSDVVIPVPQGLSVIPFGEGGGIQLSRADTRSLTATLSGPVALVLAGYVTSQWSQIQ